MIGTDGHLFGRVITAMITPFDDQLKLDLKATERLVDHLLANGSDSLVIAGTTGESPTLEDDEKLALLKAVLKQTNGKAKVIMGSGTNDTAKSIKLSQRYAELGVDGLLVVAPYYNKPNQEGLLAHFEAIAQAVSLPLILYNIPGRTGINIAPETVLSLAKNCANIHALKDSTGNVEQSADIAGKAPEQFRIYSGDDNLTLPFLSIGACGVVSVASHLIGLPIKELIGAYFTGKVDRARQLHYEHLPMFKALFNAPNPTCVKYALATLGICQPHLRLPLVPLTGPAKETMDGLLKTLNTKTAIA